MYQPKGLDSIPQVFIYSTNSMTQSDSRCYQGSSRQSLQDGNGERVSVSTGACRAWNADPDTDADGRHQREDAHVDGEQLEGSAGGDQLEADAKADDVFVRGNGWKTRKK